MATRTLHCGMFLLDGSYLYGPTDCVIDAGEHGTLDFKSIRRQFRKAKKRKIVLSQRKPLKK